MPKMIDPELKARAVRLVTEHVSEVRDCFRTKSPHR